MLWFAVDRNAPKPQLYADLAHATEALLDGETLVVQDLREFPGLERVAAVLVARIRWAALLWQCWASASEARPRQADNAAVTIARASSWIRRRWSGPLKLSAYSL